MFLDLNLNVYDIFYATDGKIKKVGSVDVNSLKKIKGTRQDSNFNSSIPNSSKNVKGQYSFAGENAKTAVPLSEKYRTEAVTQFAQNPDADVRYSLPDVDRYTEKQYNDFGWVATSGILNGKELKQLYSQFADIKLLGYKSTKTPNGENIIMTGKKYGSIDNIVFIRGTNKHPIITKIYSYVNLTQQERETTAKEVAEYEQRGHDNANEIIEAYAGHSVFSRYTLQDSISYNEYKKQRHKPSSDENSEKRNPGAESIDENISDRADSINGPAYSLPEEGAQYSIPDIARGKSNTELEQLIKEGKITTKQALDAVREEHGTMPKGENPKVDVDVPNKVSDKRGVRRFARTVLESGHLTEGMSEDAKREILNGALNYKITSSKMAAEIAQKRVKKDINSAIQEWEGLL